MKRYYKDINVEDLLDQLNNLSNSSESGNFRQLLDDAIVIIENNGMKIESLKEQINTEQDHIDQLKEKLEFIGGQYAQLAAFAPRDF